MMMDGNTNELSKRWYALKVFYNRVFQVEDLLKSRNLESYIPLRITEVVIRGRKVRRRQPAVSSLLFMRCSEEEAKALQRELMGKVMLYVDRLTRTPLVIPNDQMNRFILVTSADDTGLEYLGVEQVSWSTGQRVRVIDGLFKGAEGYIRRIKGDHRLIVAIEGVVAVATSYIPARFLEPISD